MPEPPILVPRLYWSRLDKTIATVSPNNHRDTDFITFVAMECPHCMGALAFESLKISLIMGTINCKPIGCLYCNKTFKVEIGDRRAQPTSPVNLP